MERKTEKSNGNKLRLKEMLKTELYNKLFFPL